MYILACVIPASALLERGRNIHGSISFRAQLPWKDFHTFVLTHLLVCGSFFFLQGAPSGRRMVGGACS
jgi:hypothetical protein